MCLLLGCSALLGGCVQQGRPLVAERSPIFNGDNPSVMPAKPSVAQPPRSVNQPEAVSQNRVKPMPRAPVQRARVKLLAPAQYLVRRGDSLYSIAWRFQLDHRQLARLNQIAPPYVIHPGQLLNLKAPARRGQSTPKAHQPKPPAQQAQVQTPKPASPVALVARWVWPVAGKPSRGYKAASSAGEATNKGVDFTVKGRRTAVAAANNGEVVYAGNGIGGYENLLILRHTGDLLSAYSFNGEILVKEQQRVKAGQKIADIRNTGRGSQKLHFELRKHGKPINPGSIIR